MDKKLMCLNNSFYRFLFIKLIVVILFTENSLVGQNVGINATGSAPDVSAGLDIDFSDKGVLFPRVKLGSINDAISILTPATSLLVYNFAGSLPFGYYYNSGTPGSPLWVRLSTGTNYWNLNGNAGTIASFLGTTDNQPLHIGTNNIEHLRVETNGALSTLNTGGSVYIGMNSGASYTTGIVNTAVGDGTLQNNYTGSENVSIGNATLNKNSTGNKNIALGSLALYSNMSGSDNIAIGFQSLFLNNSHNNIAIGENTLYSNTGFDNIAIGRSGLFSNLNGINNLAIGLEAMYSNTTGISNVALGSSALYSNSIGSFNVAIGHIALQINTIGTENTAIGSGALSSNINGVANTAVGANCLGNASGNYNTAVGYQSAIALSMFSEFNTAVGYQSLFTNTTGVNNTSMGSNAIRTNNGDNNTALGYNSFITSASTYSNSTALGSNTVITASNQIRVGDFSVFSIGGVTSWTTLSDRKFKTNLKEDVPGLAFILKLRPVTYNLDINKVANNLNLPDSIRNFENEIAKSKVYYSGFLAQEVEKAAKEIGFDFSGVDTPQNKNDYYGLRYADFVVPLVKAVQELYAENQKLKEQILKITHK